MENQDQNIIRQILSGDIEKYRLIMDRYAQRIFTIVVKIVSDEDDAEEVTQDVFMKAFRSLEKFDFRSSLSTWLFRIAYNEAINHYRRIPKLELAVDESMLRSVSDSQVDSVLDVENPLLEALPQAIEGLTVEERTLITLHYYEGIPLKEVAEMMNIGESTAKVRLMRTRRKLYVLINKISQRYE